jgi:hypothetical protein
MAIEKNIDYLFIPPQVQPGSREARLNNYKEKSEIHPPRKFKRYYGKR